MRVRRLSLIAVTILSVVAALPTWAHHAFAAEYDADKPFDLTGILTKVEWVNPHSWIYVDVTTAQGQVTSWQFEFGAPNALVRRGLHKSDLAIGQEVHVKGYLAKSGLPVGNATSVTLADGRNLYTGSSGTGAPGEP